MVLTAANSNKPPPTGQLPANIMHFARVLRDAGLPVGPGAVLDALDAVTGGGMSSKKDFYWVLHSIFVKRREHTVLFDHAFEVFWRKPKMIEQLMQLLFQQVRVEAKPDKKKAGQKRLAEAMFDQDQAQSQRERPRDDIELEGEYTSSAREVLRNKDFEQMSAEEERQARDAIQRMRMNRIEVKMRRFRSSPRGVVDMRATLRKSLRTGGNMAELKFKARQTREPPLVVLLDISGSMANYSRVFLHFLHALTNDRSRVQVFTFGTRLTNITRELKRRDVDEAMELVGSHVNDWSGGTRIGHILREFNVRWSRRVLAQGAHVLLMTDGLDRDDVEVLEAEMARLARSAKRVVWLNPLLRYDGFEARAAGIKAMMPYVDEFRPCHSLNTLAELAEVLSGSRAQAHDPRRWIDRAAGRLGNEVTA
ncbi:MAG: VWA domain-containing protein [Anderseniella sp.]|jgi:uncharacterized protein with von Willebrand factor type A (vWA) domain|nr:VWA domain-containing protein [Anderseniella sp.]